MSTTLLKFSVFILVGKLIPVNLFSLILASYITYQIMGLVNGTWKAFLSILLVFFMLFRTILSDEIRTSTNYVDGKPASTNQNAKGSDGPVILDSVCIISLLNAYQVLKVLHSLGMVTGWLVELLTVYYTGRSLRSFREKGGSFVNQVIALLLGFWLFFRLNLAFSTILKKSTPTLPIPPNVTWDVSESWTPDTVSSTMGFVFCLRIFCISLIVLCPGVILFIFYKNLMKWSNSISLSQVVLNFFWMLFVCNCVLSYIGLLSEKQMNIFDRMMKASGEGKPMTDPKECDAFWQVCPLTAIDEAGYTTINSTIKEPFQNIGITIKVVVNKIEEMFYG